MRRVGIVGSRGRRVRRSFVFWGPSVGRVGAGLGRVVVIRFVGCVLVRGWDVVRVVGLGGAVEGGVEG